MEPVLLSGCITKDKILFKIIQQPCEYLKVSADILYNLSLCRYEALNFFWDKM